MRDTSSGNLGSLMLMEVVKKKQIAFSLITSFFRKPSFQVDVHILLYLYKIIIVLCWVSVKMCRHIYVKCMYVHNHNNDAFLLYLKYQANNCYHNLC